MADARPLDEYVVAIRLLLSEAGIGSDGTAEWLDAKHADLDDQRPVDLIAEGRSWNVLLAVRVWADAGYPDAARWARLG